jgi:2-octaprenylphenol hydroxylase
MSPQFDILIVGGGVIGLTAALAMARCNYTVGLIEAGSLTSVIAPMDVRVYALNKASKNLLQEFNVWQHLHEDRLSPYKHMHVWDGVNQAAIDFDSRSIAAASLGYIVEESVLKQALLEQINQSSLITLFPQLEITEVHHLDKYSELVSKDSRLQGRLLLIADGARSPTRDKLGVKLTSWSYEQHAIVASVQTEKNHQQTAYQVFNSDGPLAFLPLINAHQCSIVWSADVQQAEHLMSLSEEEFNHSLSKAFNYKLGGVKLASKRHTFPLHMRHAQNYTGKNWLLLGDAAHTIHPLAGLGLNVGLADVACWYQLLQKNKVLLSARTLGAYQRERKAAVWQTILLMEGFKRLFSIESPPVTTIRGLGLRLCNQLTPLKRLFIQHAAGE